jgi:hypothetical protein
MRRAEKSREELRIDERSRDLLRREELRRNEKR